MKKHITVQALAVYMTLAVTFLPAGATMAQTVSVADQIGTQITADAGTQTTIADDAQPVVDSESDLSFTASVGGGNGGGNNCGPSFGNNDKCCNHDNFGGNDNKCCDNHDFGNGNDGNRCCDSHDFNNGNGGDRCCDSRDYGNGNDRCCDSRDFGDNRDNECCEVPGFGDSNNCCDDSDTLFPGSTKGCGPVNTQLTVNVIIVNNSSATTSDFSYGVTSNGLDVYSGPAANTRTFTITRNKPFTVIEASTTASYMYEYSGSCSGTASASSMTCTITNTFYGSPSSDVPPPAHGGNYIGYVGGTGGSVLGASTGPSCPMLNSYIKFGGNNNSDDVVFLQKFLNDHEQNKLVVNGIYDAATLAAVHAFQLKNNVDVLKPWADIGLGKADVSTGYVYKTTRWKINSIVCPGVQTAMPVLN